MSVASDGVVLEEFVTSSFDEWRREKTEEGIQHFKNGVPQPESAYQGATGNAVPGSEFSDPYRVTDYTAAEVDEFAERPDDLSQDEMQALKDVRAAYTVQHAYENVPFYRELFDDHDVDPYMVEGIDDLQELPVIDGDDVLANQPPATDTWRLKNPHANTRRPFNTSGSTGIPKTVFYSYDETDRMYDDVRRGLLQLGAEEGDTVVNYFPFVGLNISCMGNEGGMEKLDMETVPISNTPYPAEPEARLLQAHRPDDDDQQYLMMGLPSHVDSKGREFARNGFDPEEFGFDTIILAGEPVSEARKESIAETYGADVYEFLGSTEGGGFAYECMERSDRLHLFEDSVHAEVLDKETYDPVEPGEEGELVITRLLHPGEESSTPIINYNQGDFVTYYEPDGDCDCRLSGGRTIKPPRRDSWNFILGAVGLDPVYFEERIYGNDTLEEIAEGYQLQVDYDKETGRDHLSVLIESDDPDYIGMEETEIAPTDEPKTALDELANAVFAGNSHLQDTVDTVGAARIDFAIVDEIAMEPGKPQRLIDRRHEQ